MSQSAPQRDWLEQLLQRYLLPGLAVMYLLAAFLPQLGVWLRSTPVWGTETLGLGKVTMVNLLLAGLLFNTGLSVPLKELFCLTRHPKLVSLALAIRVTSCGLIILMALLLGWFLHGNVWNELQLGLILVAVMPVANSSAGWSHHSDANVGLSMWLILISVLLSPLLVPGLLEISAPLTAAGFREGYSQLARGYAGSFVMTWVIIPAVLGVIFRSLFLKNSYPQWKSRIKLLTSLFLLLLNYANGAVSLPGLLRGGQTGSVVLSLGAACVLCGLLFAAAWLVSRLCRLKQRDQLSIMYSTAMSNTGVALVLATTILPQQALLHLLIIFYTLVQHIIAGVVDELAQIRTRQTVRAAHSEGPCTMTSQPVLKDSCDERPATQTGSQAAT